jgi:hypothetical protein
MKINLTLSPVDNLLNLIEKDNPGLQIESQQVTVGVPIEDSSVAGRNTRVLLTAVKNAGFSGSADVLYRRLALDDGIGDLPPAIILNWDDTQQQRHDKVISALGLMASEVILLVDGDPFHVDTNPIYIPSDVTLRAKEDSLLYAGADLTIGVALEEYDYTINGRGLWVGQIYLTDEVETL